MTVRIERREPLRTTVLVVGGGIAGASVAAELSRDLEVTLVEAEESPGFHSTGRSAAMFLKGYGNGPVRALTAASEAFLLQPESTFCETPILHRTGALTIAGPRRLLRLRREAEESGFAWLERDELLTRVPILRPSASSGATLDPDAASIDVDALLQAYLRQARARGARILTGERVTAASRQGALWRVETSVGEIEAEVLVNAAGAWADPVAAMCGLEPLGIIPLRRTAAIVPVPDGMDVSGWPLVIDVDETFYFKPEAGRLVVSPADETPVAAHDVQAEELDVAIAIARFEEATDMPIRRVSHRWAGLRSFSADRTPVVGPDPREPSFFWLAGQGGYGIQTAPAMAKVAADLVTGVLRPDDEAVQGLPLSRLRPDRLLTAR